MKYYKLSEEDLNTLISTSKQIALMDKGNSDYLSLLKKQEEIKEKAVMKIPDVDAIFKIRNLPSTSNGKTYINVLDEYGVDHLLRIDESAETCELNTGSKVRVIGQMINDFGTINAFEVRRED